MHLLQAVGIQLRLSLALSSVDGGLLGLDHGQRLAVVVPKHVIAVADRTGGRLVQDFDLLAN
jgi:hypothetical protein